MRIGELAATADLVGRRVRLGWTFTPEDGETVADAPRVTVRRKERDFAFPPPTARDPYLVYDSATFPPAPLPAVLEVRDLPDRELVDDAQRVTERTITVADITAGQPREVLRRTVRTVFSPDRRALRQEVELLDVAGALAPGVPSYYELDSPELPTDADRAAYRATATPGETYGLNRTLYELIPAIHRRHDTVRRRPDAGTGLVPEATAGGGQLRRLIDIFGMTLDAMRSSAEGLRGLRDPAVVDPKFLPLLAHWIGWDLTAAAGLERQRNEIRNAPRLYEAVGSLAGLRTIVDHYTGWSTRVVEFAQHLARTNAAPQRNLFALVERGGAWWGMDDAAPLLGFAAPNHDDEGGAGIAAELVGSIGEPYALRGGMTITIAIDGALPATITFGPRDFADIAAATASEVAAVLERHGELQADTVGGAVRLRSHRLDDGSRLEVSRSGASLVSLDGAPGGRLSAVSDAQGRLWLAYATTAGPGGSGLSRLQVKPHLHGRWRDTQPVLERPLVAQSAPTLLTLPGGDLLLAWIDRPGTAEAQLRWRRGSARPFSAARLLGERSEPFALTPGHELVLTGYGASETFLVDARDYADVAAATAAEVAAAFNGQLEGVSAAPALNGALALRTAATGPGVTLRVELTASATAHALGLGDRALLGRGGWDARIDWDAPAPVSSVTAGRHADTAGVVEPDGAVRLFWSTHHHGRWRIARARWDDRIRVATPAGAGVRAPNGAWSSTTTVDGLPDDDVRAVAVDGDGASWYATAAGGAVSRPDGSIAVLSHATTGGGLMSDDVRAVAAGPDGTVWFAHADGVSRLDTTGAWRTLTTAEGLAGDDCRHVVVASDGTAWFATAAGLSRLDTRGNWRTWTAAIDGLPSDDVRHCAIASDGVLWAATASGLVLVGADGAARPFALVAAGAAAGSDDVRAVATAPRPSSPPGDGSDSIWAATAAGVVELRSMRRAASAGVADGLPSMDCRSVLVASDGTVWVGTAAGAVWRAADGGWQVLTTADGLPHDEVRALHGPWSAPLEFAPAGGGDRDPFATLDDANRLWLAWSERRTAGDAADTWLLRARRLVLPAAAWSAPIAVTAVAPGERAKDRHPHLVPALGGGARVYLDSDRSGGPRLWVVDIDPADAAAAPVAVAPGVHSDVEPAAVTLPGGDRVLLFRSDRSFPLARLGGGVPGIDAPDTSRRAPDEASLRRFAGTTTVSLTDLDRNRGSGRFDDLLSYTPQKPAGTRETPLEPDELYTRATIGLYVERGLAGRPLTRADADRLRDLLQRFLPANLRAVIVLRPSGLLLEQVFGRSHPLEDAYADSYPFVEHLGGLSDAAAAALPDWHLFLATDSPSITVDPVDLTTLRRRTWRPPPQ
jgi:phage tail-like protein